MTLDSLSETSLGRLEQYLHTNPYREYTMSKPYLPRGAQHSKPGNRLLPQQQSTILAFHELLDNQKNSLTLDRLAYKLRMKSDLNIDTLRETHLRRRYHQRPQQNQHQHNSQQTQQNASNSNINDTLSSISSKQAQRQQPSIITTSTNTMKTYHSEDLNGIEGSAVRVGTLNDLLKQFHRTEHHLVRRPPDYLDSASTLLSSNVSTNDRILAPKPQQHQQQERRIKQPQALTEYQFNVPTFPTSPSRTAREPTVHQGLIYQYRTRERLSRTAFPLLHRRSASSSERERLRLNSLVIEDRQSTVMSSHEKRIHDLREKSLMRFEKQLCVCNKLNIVDPFNSKSVDNFDSTLPHLPQSHQQQQQQQQPHTSTSYIFPPVRPFGYLTKKTTEDTQQLSSNQPSAQHTKKKRGIKKKRNKNTKETLDSLEKPDINETNDEDEHSQILDRTSKSPVSLINLPRNVPNTPNTTINVDLNIATAVIQNTDDNEL